MDNLTLTSINFLNYEIIRYLQFYKENISIVCFSYTVSLSDPITDAGYESCLLDNTQEHFTVKYDGMIFLVSLLDVIVREKLNTYEIPEEVNRTINVEVNAPVEEKTPVEVKHIVLIEQTFVDAPGYKKRFPLNWEDNTFPYEERYRKKIKNISRADAVSSAEQLRTILNSLLLTADDILIFRAKKMGSGEEDVIDTRMEKLTL